MEVLLISVWLSGLKKIIEAPQLTAKQLLINIFNHFIEPPEYKKQQRCSESQING